MTAGEIGTKATGTRSRRPGQLAGGPHGMSRAEVETHQTGRIVAAMGALVAEHGYERTTVERVIQRAGVSRRTFYELRGGREDWFLVVCNAAAERLLERVETAARDGRSRGGERAIEALVDFCRTDPSGARTCFVETLAATDAARAWRATLVDRVAATIAAADSASGSDAAARAAIGAVIELAGRRPEQLDRGHAISLATALLAIGEGGAEHR